MTKIATMPIYGKNFKKSSSQEPKGRWAWNLVCSIGCSNTTKFIQMMTLGWHGPIFTPRSNLVPCAFVWETGKTLDFSETIVYDLKLATNDWSDKKFLLTSKLCPLGAVCPLIWGYICVKIMKKKMYKIRHSKRFLWNLEQMGKVIRPFCWHQNFDPGWLSTPALGLYTCIKSWKILYKIRLQRFFFETCNKWLKWQDVQSFVPKGLSASALGLYTCIKSWKKKNV